MLASCVNFRRVGVLALVAWSLIASGCSREETPDVRSGQPSQQSRARQLNTLVMWTSGEKMNYLPDVVTRFNQEQHTTAATFPDGTRQPIHVHLVSINSGPMSDHLIRKLREQVDFPPAGRIKLSDVIRLTTRGEEPVWSFEGEERQRKEHLIARDLAFSTQHPVHIFSIGLGQDVDWEVLRLLAEATNSSFNRVSEKDLAEVLERFGKYF